jgi:hypothetical protein
MQRNFHLLFDQYEVDLVLYGHNHNYMRTYPLKHNPSAIDRPTMTSTTRRYSYRLELEAVGSYGFDGRNSYVAEQFDNAHGYLDISVTDDYQTLKGAFYSNSGSTRDCFIIKKTQDAVPEPTEKDFSLTVNLIINLGPSDSWDDTTVQVPSAIQVGTRFGSIIREMMEVRSEWAGL